MNRAITVALAVFFCGAAFYTCLGPLSTFGSQYVFSASALTAALLLAALAASGIGLAAALRDRSPGAIDVGVAACWVAPLFVSTLLGVDPIAGLQICGIALLSAAFYLAAIAFADRNRVATVLAAFLAIGLAAVASAIGMNLSRIPIDVWVFNHGRAAGPFATANYFGAFLVTFAIGAAGGALAWNGRLRALAVTCLVAAAAGLYLSHSRGAQLGTIAGLGAFVFGLGRRRAAAGLSAIFIAAAAVAIVWPDTNHDPSENFARWSIWKTGVSVAQLFPFSGAGPMGYAVLYPAVAPAVPDPAAAQGYLQPHNVVISLWADLGTAGLASIVAGWVLFARRRRAELLRCDRPSRIVAIALCAAIGGTLVQGLFDLAGTPELIFVWMPFAGLAAAAARSGSA